MNLEMVSDRRKHPLEASVKVLSRLDIRNPVKTSPVQKQAKLLKKVLRRHMHRQTFPIIILDSRTQTPIKGTNAMVAQHMGQQQIWANWDFSQK